MPLATCGEMAAAVHAKVGSPSGPTSFGHRYRVEDVPYGLVFHEVMARIASVPIPHVSGVITLLSSACSLSFRHHDTLLADRRIAHLDRDERVAR